MKTINSCLAESITRYKGRISFVDQSTGEQVSYRAFGRRLGQVARLLKDEGVKTGEVVTLISKNSVDLAIMLYGVMAYGAIANPLNPQLTPLEVASVVNHCDSNIIFSDTGLAPDGYQGKRFDIAAYRDAAPLELDLASSGSVREGTGALLIYTSGTTGNPKGILLSHRNITYNVQTAIGRLGMDSGHTTLCLLPLFHTFGFISDLSTMILSGGKAVVMEMFDISRLALLEIALREYGVNSFSAVPLMFELMLRFNCDLKAASMKFCVSGAAPLKEKTSTEFLAQYGFPIIPAYGLTEATCFATLSRPDRIESRSIGVPANVEIKIISDDSSKLGPREIGELVIKGESVMRGGYFKGGDDCFLDSGKEWFKTGDLGYHDEKGNFYITGRKKNMVIRGGEKVYLEDIDTCLSSWDLIGDSATVSFEDDDGERIACFLVLREGAIATRSEIMSYIRTRMGNLKCPDLLVFRDKIPRTPTNKVRLRELQQLAVSCGVGAKALG
jgi:acyl-CoA synthetase (AMP-forming)/AMP-acid ligase II